MALNRKPPAKRVAAFSHIEYPGFLTLYLDDIQDVLDFVAQQGASPSLSAGNASADVADDLMECTSGELRRVSIRVPEPEVDVVLTPQSAYVRTVKDDPAAIAMVEAVGALLRERRTMFRGAARALWVHGKGVLILGGLALITPATIGLLTVGSFDFLLLGTFSIIFLAFMALPLLGSWKSGGVRIVPERRREVRRNRSVTANAVVVAIASAVVGSLVTYLLTRLL